MYIFVVADNEDYLDEIGGQYDGEEIAEIFSGQIETVSQVVINSRENLAKSAERMGALYKDEKQFVNDYPELWAINSGHEEELKEYEAIRKNIKEVERRGIWNEERDFNTYLMQLLPESDRQGATSLYAYAVNTDKVLANITDCLDGKDYAETINQVREMREDYIEAATKESCAESLRLLNYAIEKCPNEDLAISVSDGAIKLIEWVKEHINEKDRDAQEHEPQTFDTQDDDFGIH